VATGTDRQRGIKLGTVLGAPVLLMPSWFLIAVLITLSYAPAVQTRLPDVGVATFVIAFIAALLLLGSVFLHELAHAIAARAVGTPPSHIVLDLWGGHTAFDAEMTSPGRSALVSLVGPGTNGVLAVLGWLLLPAVPAQGVSELLLLGVIYSNGFVAIFNALPGLPLDGGRALEALVWKITGSRGMGTLIAGWVGRAVALGLVLWTLVRPLLLGRTPDITTAAWVLLVAWMLWQGATGALQVARWRSRAPTVRVDALTRAAVGVPARASLAEALRRAAAAGVDEVVLTGADGVPLAVLDATAIAAVPAERLEVTAALAVSRALPAGAIVPHALAGEGMITYLQHRAHHEFAVLDDSGAVVGVLLARDVAHSLTGRRA
jgi:Zn-dependent protease